jgi:multiple sugar transport system permease protein
VIFVTTLLSTIWTSANLTQIFVLTGGGPSYATTTLPLLSYMVAIPGHQLGAGAAISMLMLPFYLVLVFFLTRRMLKQE